MNKTEHNHNSRLLLQPVVLTSEQMEQVSGGGPGDRNVSNSDPKGPHSDPHGNPTSSGGIGGSNLAETALTFAVFAAVIIAVSATQL